MPTISRVTRRNDNWRGQPRVPGGSPAGGEWASQGRSPFTTTQDLPQSDTPEQIRAARELEAKKFLEEQRKREEYISPERKKELDSAASFLNKSAARFESEGGSIDSETDAGERDMAARDFMEGRLQKLWVEKGFGQADVGLKFTRNAIEGRGLTGPWEEGHLAIAYAGGDVAGALTWYSVPGLYSNVAHVELLGSTGIVHGTGTALIKSQLKEFAAAGMSVTGSPTFAAIPLYQRLGGSGPIHGPLGTVGTYAPGGRRAARGALSVGEWSMPANEIKYLASKLT